MPESATLTAGFDSTQAIASFGPTTAAVTRRRCSAGRSPRAARSSCWSPRVALPGRRLVDGPRGARLARSWSMGWRTVCAWDWRSRGDAFGQAALHAREFSPKRGCGGAVLSRVVQQRVARARDGVLLVSQPVNRQAQRHAVDSWRLLCAGRDQVGVRRSWRELTPGRAGGAAPGQF